MGPGPKIKIYKISPKYRGVSEIFISVLCRARFLICKKWTTFLILFHLKIFPRKFLAISSNSIEWKQTIISPKKCRWRFPHFSKNWIPNIILNIILLNQILSKRSPLCLHLHLASFNFNWVNMTQKQLGMRPTFGPAWPLGLHTGPVDLSGN